MVDETRKQPSNKHRFVHHAGRNTASNVKTVAKTNPTIPSAPKLFYFGGGGGGGGGGGEVWAEGQVLNKCVIESAPECGPLCSPQGMEIYTPSCRKCGKVKYEKYKKRSYYLAKLTNFFSAFIF